MKKKILLITFFVLIRHGLHVILIYLKLLKNMDQDWNYIQAFMY